MTISKNIRKLLAEGEGTNVEYKQEISKPLKDSFVAFANTKGGYVLIGVQDTMDKNGRQIGKIVGIQLSDYTRNQIQSAADSTNDKIDIHIDEQYDENGKGIYVIHIPEGKHKPYCTTKGRYLLRRDGQNCPITPIMMQAFFSPKMDKTSGPLKKLYLNELHKIKRILRECIINIKESQHWYLNYDYYHQELAELVENLTINDKLLLINCRKFLKMYSQSAELLRKQYFANQNESLNRMAKNLGISGDFEKRQSNEEPAKDKLQHIDMDELKKRLNNLYIVISRQIDAFLG